MREPDPTDSAPTTGRSGAGVARDHQPPTDSWVTNGHLVSPLYLPHLEAVREARSYVADQVHAIGLPACAQDASLMVCELAANAVLHARTPFTVHLRPTLEGGVRVEVHDESWLPPVFTAPSATAMSGRGLNLVATLATRWGSHPVLPAPPVAPAGAPAPAQLGKIVWFEVEAAPTAPADEASVEELLARWDGAAPPASAWRRPRVATGTIVSSLPAAGDLHDVVITDLPVAELLEVEESLDDLLRELQLRLLAPAAGPDEGLISQPQRPLEGDLLVAAHLDAAARGFEPARRQVRDQVTHAAARGQSLITLHLLLPASAGTAAAYFRDAVAAAEPLRAEGGELAGSDWRAQVRQHYLDQILAQLPPAR